ncbi:MAG: EF-hand domain-containing protein [Tabrizicola sp.]|uniref:EF-hand domain-containing protein n=1 Tax=Tabrizicola sp. TaxID=2005166 RepID=UPI0027362922|nr:EF-hand domain-containing protein [Tabrizicola sp.]MDP3262190.1 EF-hand domain-containing protein [Tabrizicola sp.]MDP3648064.1 EF-hand domain-containing protein [Paracoccaceae bacterium]MDZ4069652.1 EF-hand domain-containing protein [Tabrizicola sp.]
MKRFALVLAPLAFVGAAYAQDLPVVEDTDANGTWSLAELQAVWPELTEDAFKGVDANGDGAVDQTELKAALDNAVLTAPAPKG